MDLEKYNITNTFPLNNSLLVVQLQAKEEPWNNSGSSIYGIYVTSYARLKLLE